MELTVDELRTLIAALIDRRSRIDSHEYEAFSWPDRERFRHEVHDLRCKIEAELKQELKK